MLKRFVAEREDQPGDAWLARFVAGREEAARWYLGRRLAEPPSAAQCRAAMLRHMPELAPLYDKACELVGDDDLGHRILSHYRPPPVTHGCSQAVWLGEGGPALVRNYDFPLDMVSGRFEATSWLRRVIAKTQRPWGGCLDGMNEDGLAASLTTGGGREQGQGFAVILILRYVLEACRNVNEAVAALSRLPFALSHNITLLDRTGAYATLYLGPGRKPSVTRQRVCANHQEVPLARAFSAERHQCLREALEDSSTTLASLIARFFAPPLYARRPGFTTIYTAVYRPAEGRVDYLWPGKQWTQSFVRFVEQDYTHDFGPPRG